MLASVVVTRSIYRANAAYHVEENKTINQMTLSCKSIDESIIKLLLIRFTTVQDTGKSVTLTVENSVKFDTSKRLKIQGNLSH